MPPPEETAKEGERWGAMAERMKNVAGDIEELKTGQEKQERAWRAAFRELNATLIEQGKEITRLKTQVGLAGAIGGAVGSLVVGFILLLAQKGSP